MPPELAATPTSAAPAAWEPCRERGTIAGRPAPEKGALRPDARLVDTAPVVHALHPVEALFEGERPFPAIPACDHYAGNERFMRRALALQAEAGAVFDVTLDLEDGAPAGREREHAQLVAELVAGPSNALGMAGARIHDCTSPWWRQDVDVLVRGAGARLSHLTLPKATAARQVVEMITYIQNACAASKLGREIPIHVLIETHGALQDAFKIAALPWMATLEFGLMDFVSAHHGAIGAEAMSSPGQFEHALVRRAKSIVVAAALAYGLVPAHNVTTDLDRPEQAGADALRARREFGFLRMWSIHPSQIAPITAAFAPDDDDVSIACEVLLAAQRAQWAPIRHESRLHDRASYRFHWELLQRARLAGRALSGEAVAAFFGPRGHAAS
jgi:citrate lyase subunit beta / citryl-CoA lyase